MLGRVVKRRERNDDFESHVPEGYDIDACESQEDVKIKAFAHVLHHVATREGVTLRNIGTGLYTVEHTGTTLVTITVHSDGVYEVRKRGIRQRWHTEGKWKTPEKAIMATKAWVTV